MKTLDSSWQFNFLNIYNFNQAGPYEYIFQFLDQQQNTMKGDVLEAGVYRGRMTLSMAMYLKQQKLPGVIHGFDTFSGFPGLDPQDEVSNFEHLYTNGLISKNHYLEVQKLQVFLRDVMKRGTQPDQISTSGSFADSRYDELKQKIDFFGLDNIQLHVGPFSTTMKQESLFDVRYSVVFIDCDLFQGYLDTLNYGWDRLLPGGIVFLDEYYSLKFPGARLAVDQFLRGVDNFQMINVARPEDDFERWVIVKK